ncbi:putative six-hairpin glycosidase superfamily [Septoria linicola]|nr:putative six-hairpin glycosidase superfamily [Septoria linicola]
MALAGQYSFAELYQQDDPIAELGAVTDLRTPADTAVSKGFEAILMHATANNNPHAGDDHSYDHGLFYGDYYLIEAGDRLLE